MLLLSSFPWPLLLCFSPFPFVSCECLTIRLSFRGSPGCLLMPMAVANRRQGELVSRVRLYGLDELQRRNSAGECLLVIDGMVLDVTRWLPQHPGGSRIIPTQSLNVDATRFFEVGALLAPLRHCCLSSIDTRSSSLENTLP